MTNTPATDPTAPSGSPTAATTPQVLRGVHVLSLALNLPGPAALLRLAAMGAACSKIEPPGGDPMAQYSPTLYQHLHRGVELHPIDLKQAGGRAALHQQLARSDVLLTSSRPSALARLGLDSARLAADFPQLAWIAIVGDYPPDDEVPGHDLTYLAEAGLVDQTLPPTLWADMGGSLLAVEAVLQAVLTQRSAAPGEAARGLHLTVALAEAARYAALPRQHGLTAPGALLGGAHPGYQVLHCADGRVALAALEPHFLKAWQRAIGAENLPANDAAALIETARAWCSCRSAAELNAAARTHDLPLLAWPVT